MGTQRVYEGLPFSWQGKSRETIQNDQRWLESITRNAAPFTDWWAKARIVQLAYSTPPATTPKLVNGVPTYAGLSSEQEIAASLRSLCDPAQYPGFDRAITEDYVIETLNSWRSQQFSQAISRNFEVYVDSKYTNVFLVTSTATPSAAVDRHLPPLRSFRPLFNVNELAQIIQQRQIQYLTLRTHGYSTPAMSFYQGFVEEAEMLHLPDPLTQASSLAENHVYIGYQWPSEQPVVSPGLWSDLWKNPGIVFKFLFLLSGISGIAGTLLYLFLNFLALPLLNGLGKLPGISPAFAWSNFADAAHGVTWYWIVPTVFMLWLLAFQLLRLTVYQRDRNRAIHYGAPDLAEFLWRLDKALNDPGNWPTPAAATNPGNPLFKNLTLTANLIGHSMGALVMVNMLRTLSDRFGKDDRGSLLPDFVPVSTRSSQDLALQASNLYPAGSGTSDKIGDHLKLDKLILTSPDIPLEFLREGRNNYVRSAMRRCNRIYLLSSDRDTVLRYLSTLSNWFTEPSIEMAGLRLGNVYLQPMRLAGSTPYRPYIRIMVHSEAAVQPTSAYDLFRKFNYLDCSEMRGQNGTGGVNAAPFKLNRFNGLLIDAINTTLFLLKVNRLDVHGGYFQTNTRSFQILQFLITTPDLADEAIKAQIEQLIAGTPIRFLPSQPWVMPESTSSSHQPNPSKSFSI